MIIGNCDSYRSKTGTSELVHINLNRSSQIKQVNMNPDKAYLDWIIREI